MHAVIQQPHCFYGLSARIRESRLVRPQIYPQLKMKQHQMSHFSMIQSEMPSRSILHYHVSNSGIRGLQKELKYI